MYLPRGLCQPIFILLLISVTPSSLASPTRDLAKQDEHSKALFAFSSPTHNTLQHISVRPRANFDSLYELPSGWVGRVQQQMSFLPVQVAAGYLTTFYNNVVVQVRSEWVSKTPVNHFTIGWENIQLDFFSATRTIPWNFVIAFAQKMLGETQLGYVSDISESRDMFYQPYCL